MDLKRFSYLVKALNMTSSDLRIFLTNYYDAIAFNDFLINNKCYLHARFDKPEFVEPYINYFKANGLDDLTIKNLIISIPIIFSVDDINKKLDVIYKDGEVEGVLIIDQNNEMHSYRLCNLNRSISESLYLLNNISLESDIELKKSYYTKKH